MKFSVLEVMYSVDVEAWPRCPDWKIDNLEADLNRDIYGATPSGEFGLRYQVDTLKKHGLKGVFFVEALFACEVGIGPLQRIVDTVQEGGSEVQLHIHTEWFEKMSNPFLEKRAYNIRELSLEEQTKVIQKALSNLEKAGAKKVRAYRAGNFGADFNTLKALVANDICFDSSYNLSYLDKGCGLRLPTPLVQPQKIEGLWEYPVSCFRDYPGHYRPAQLCAVSSAELQAAMEMAYQKEWNNFMIVSHSFELLQERKVPLPHAQPDWSVIHRFESMCEFLGENKERFKTVGFQDVSPPKNVRQPELLHLPLLGTGLRTSGRMFSQALRRLPRKKEEKLRRLLKRFQSLAR